MNNTITRRPTQKRLQARRKAARRKRATSYYVRKGSAIIADCAIVCMAHHFGLLATVLAAPMIAAAVVAVICHSCVYMAEVSR